jgi:hypothetical protein
MSEEKKRKVDEYITGASWYLPNIQQKSTTTTSSTTPQTTSTTTVDAPTKTTTAESSTFYSDKVKKGGQAEYEKSMRDQGFAKNSKGEWVRNDSSLGSVLNMQKHNQEVERVNRAKALNSGLFNAISTIGDMISAGTGGNVYKREKNTIAEDAAKDTIARRDAAVAAEAAAKEKDRSALLNALKNAQVANDRYLEMHGIKKTSQTSGGYKETRTTENSGGRTTQRTTNTQSPDPVRFTPIVVHSADGSYDTLDVDKAMAQLYKDEAWNELQRINLSQNTELARVLEEQGYTDSNGKLKPTLKDRIIDDPNVYPFLPLSVQQMNRELYKRSETFGSYVNSIDFKNLPLDEQYAAIERIEARINGTPVQRSGYSTASANAQYANSQRVAQPWDLVGAAMRNVQEGDDEGFDPNRSRTTSSLR